MRRVAVTWYRHQLSSGRLGAAPSPLGFVCLVSPASSARWSAIVTKDADMIGRLEAGGCGLRILEGKKMRVPRGSTVRRWTMAGLKGRAAAMGAPAVPR